MWIWDQLNEKKDLQVNFMCNHIFLYYYVPVLENILLRGDL